MILLFSSDYYPVYKRDIFSVASLPDNYCYHFRYKEEYVSEAITKSVNREGCTAMIIFVAGNSKTNSNLLFIPIRLARIIKIYHEPQTKLFHVYFTLGQFIELLDEVNSLDEKPQDIYLGNQIIQPRYKVIPWIEVVEKLNPHGNNFFFKVGVESNDKVAISPQYDAITFEPYFKLIEGTTYLVKISISDSNESKEENKILTKMEGKDIGSNIGESINSGLDLDDRTYKLAGLLLGDINSPVNMLRISTSTNLTTSVNISNDYEVKLLFDVKKDVNRFWIYFAFSLLVFLGGGLIAVDLSNESVSLVTRLFIKCIGLATASFAAAQLFFRFNKK